MKSAAPYVVIAVLIAAIAALQFAGSVALIEGAGVKTHLPDRVGHYTAIDYVYCQNEQCLAATRVPPGDEPPEKCPQCGGQVAPITLAEKMLLPEGTRVIKRSYEAPGRTPVHVSIVIAGRERRSIHKPQICLRGQGLTIRNQRVESVSVAKNKHLSVMVLEAGRRRPDVRQFTTSYAYWFASPRRETAHHLSRLFWIATDGVLFGKRYTWAYVAVSTTATNQNEARTAVLAFIRELYPHLRTR